MKGKDTLKINEGLAKTKNNKYSLRKHFCFTKRQQRRNLN